MKIHQDLYKYLEASQVIAIDANFASRKGTLHLARVKTIQDIGKPKHTEIDVAYGYSVIGEQPLTREEKIKLNRIVYGWGPKVHSAPKAQEGLEEEAEVETGSFSKIKNSLHKDMMHLVPLNVIREVAAVYTANFKQYGEDWKVLPNAKKEFYNSMMRHLERWQSGETADPDDGRKHIVKALGNLIFLVWHELKEDGNDLQG